MAVAAMGLTACNGDYAQPPVPEPEGGIEAIGTGEWNKPMGVYQVSLGAVNDKLTEDPWVTGYIVGWINIDVSNVMSAVSTEFTVPATVSTNIVLAADPDETDWSKCISVQLPSGDVRNALNLSSHPENLGSQVTIQGTTGSKYCSVYGVRSVTAYKWGAEGIEPEQPAPPATFRKVSTVTAGKDYLIVADGTKMALPLGGNYGYIQAEDVKPVNDEISLKEASSYFTLTTATGGWQIIQPDGRYVYLSGTYNSFNVGSDASVDGSVWTITPETDGTFSIKNVSNGKVFQYDTTYGSYGAYSDMRGVLPALYEKVEE
jgi:hypothetical protein